MAVVESLGLGAFRRRLVVGSFPRFSSLEEGLAGLRFVQADPIRSPARAQDLILRQRVEGYFAGELEEEFPRLEADEGYLFAYGFMAREVWRILRRRSGGRLKKLERQVLEAVSEMGEAHPRDLDAQFGKRSVRNDWGGQSQETKRVLEHLHHEGHLRVCRRVNGVRVYQRVEEDWNDLDPLDRYRALLETTLEVFGPTGVSFLLSETRHLKGLPPKRKDRLVLVDQMLEEGVFSRVEIEGVQYIWIREQWEGMEVPERVRILAPFDPLVRNRERFEQVFGWEYRFEAYVPAKKRVRGYYAMPLLWREAVIGWANARVENSRLKVEFGYVGKRPQTRAFRRALEKEVESLALFLGLESGSWELPG